MLSKEDNDLLIHVGPGSAINAYFKHFWLPVMTSRHLDADGAPMKIKVLGENYVVFRDTEGHVGCLDEACPHRGISLSLARNENNALTCIFHGWSFNAKGECVATPTEPNKSPSSSEAVGQNNFCKKVRVRSYPVREAGGAIWVYLAPGEPARFPDLPIFHVPPDHVFAKRGVAHSNWAQNMEAVLDISHVPVLHRDFLHITDWKFPVEGPIGKFEIETTDCGFRTYWSQERGDEDFLRVDECIAPNISMIASNEDEVGQLLLFVPVDDRTTLFWVFLWDPDNKVLDGSGLTKASQPDLDFLHNVIDRANPNAWQNREAMKNGRWSGAPSFSAEDVICLESIPVRDRTTEQLCSSDVAIIRHRRDLLKELRAIRDGGWKGRSDDADVNYRSIRGVRLMAPAGSNHSELMNEKQAARRAKLASE